MIYLEKMQSCTVCPRNCKVDRSTATGYCRSGTELMISSWNKHYGEEKVFSGTRGSGTIFFTNCNLHCVFCQNYDISQYGHGSRCSINELVEIMLTLQQARAHNINLVTPTHFTPQIRSALALARKQGLTIPVLWNSNAYEKKETLADLEGLVDIYMPDCKYSLTESAETYSEAPDYFCIAQAAIREMFRQVGHLQLDDTGIASRGILIRLLLLPNDLDGLENILVWIRDNLGLETWINLMSQYYPAFRAAEFPGLERRLLNEEYARAKKTVRKMGFMNALFQ
ncbi:MAG: radical SAM protein, partial [Candidatus Cloacimonetes bacterium]|nr:radical SAM protein [Candidatus Cloacimonadota bacterium]